MVIDMVVIIINMVVIALMVIQLIQNSFHLINCDMNPRKTWIFGFVSIRHCGSRLRWFFYAGRDPKHQLIALF